MPLIVAVTLYGGVFIGYVVGTFDKDEPQIISVQSTPNDLTIYRMFAKDGVPQ